MCKTETIKGLHVKDYHDLDVQALEEIICLNKQLENNLKQIRLAVNDGVNHQALRLLDILIEDNSTHTEYCVQCQGDILQDMYESQTSDDLRRGTPCDYPDNDGHYSCPFDANGGDDCRNFCGLGVDE